MNNGEMAKGYSSQKALTAALESGYAIAVTEAFSLTPYGKVAYSRTGKASYALGNGFEADIHAANSFQGEIGALAESEFSVAGRSVRPYAKAALSREFVNNNDFELNGIAFSSNYAGNIGKYGVGVTADVADSASVYAEVNYQNGNKVETPVNATAGFRMTF